MWCTEYEESFVQDSLIAPLEERRDDIAAIVEELSAKASGAAAKEAKAPPSHSPADPHKLSTTPGDSNHRGEA